MSQQLHAKKDIPHENILPEDKTQALRKLVKITEQLCMLADKETQALLQNDLVTFAILQQEKELVSRSYAKASAEFRARLEEFRGTDSFTLDRLEKLQKELGEKTRSNTSMVEKMHQRAKKNTQDTLLSVQELAQKKPVAFEVIENNKAEGE